MSGRSFLARPAGWRNALLWGLLSGVLVAGPLVLAEGVRAGRLAVDRTALADAAVVFAFVVVGSTALAARLRKGREKDDGENASAMTLIRAVQEGKTGYPAAPAPADAAPDVREAVPTAGPLGAKSVQVEAGGMAQDAERRYPINSHEGYGFFAGLATGNRQVLVGLLCPDLVAFFFDPAGNLLDVERRPVGFFRDVTPLYDIYDERIPALIENWRAEMGFRPATIKVKKCFSHRPYVGIEDYPAHFGEILSDPEEGEEEKGDVRGSMRLWDEGGQFVLQWGNDFWLDESGEVVSS